MKSMLSQLLLSPLPPAPQGGRKVRFDLDEPDILVSTGPMDECILALLRHHAFPLTSREITTGIGSNASQVNRTLRAMLDAGLIEVIDMPGCVREFTLK